MVTNVIQVQQIVSSLAMLSLPFYSQVMYNCASIMSYVKPKYGEKKIALKRYPKCIFIIFNALHIIQICHYFIQ